MIDNSLIFDLGAYNGDTLKTYIDNYKIIAVECNPKLVNKLNSKYKDYESLIVVNKCISDTDNTIQDFYISDHLVWSSANQKISERIVPSKEIVKVSTVTLKTLIEQYGSPVYCKIDIEGSDILAIKSLNTLPYEQLPKVISCETECLGNENPHEVTGTEILDYLHSLGYDNFFLASGDKLINFDPQEMEKYPWRSYIDTRIKLKSIRASHDFTDPWSFWWDVYAMRED